jgi:hypothetical protein
MQRLGAQRLVGVERDHDDRPAARISSDDGTEPLQAHAPDRNAPTARQRAPCAWVLAEALDGLGVLRFYVHDQAELIRVFGIAWIA